MHRLQQLAGLCKLVLKRQSVTAIELLLIDEGPEGLPVGTLLDLSRMMPAWWSLQPSVADSLSGFHALDVWLLDSERHDQD